MSSVVYAVPSFKNGTDVDLVNEKIIKIHMWRMIPDLIMMNIRDFSIFKKNDSVRKNLKYHRNGTITYKTIKVFIDKYKNNIQVHGFNFEKGEHYEL